MKYVFKDECNDDPCFIPKGRKVHEISEKRRFSPFSFIGGFATGLLLSIPVTRIFFEIPSRFAETNMNILLFVSFLSLIYYVINEMVRRK